MWNGAGDTGPFLGVEIHEGVTGLLQKLLVGHLVGVGGIAAVEDVSILQCQLEEVLEELGGPPTGTTGKWVVLYHLIKQINTTHMPVVVADHRRSLHLYLLIAYVPLSPCLTPFNVVLLDRFVCQAVSPLGRR